MFDLILKNSETSLDLIMNVRFGLGTQVGCQSRPTGLGRDRCNGGDFFLEVERMECNVSLYA